jgi:membrane protease YdiL (CAAX protease family)
MISLILILLILIWLLLSLFFYWKWKRILTADFPLFLLCLLLHSSGMTAYTSFTEGRHISIAITWLPILYWFYIRRSDVAFLFNYKSVNLIIGCSIGILLGTGVVVAAVDLTKSPEISRWIPGLVFDSIQRSVAEEIMFRCLLLNYLKKHISNVHLANTTQGFIFLLLHLYGTYLQFPFLLIFPTSFGILTGFIVIKQKSIYGSLLAHALYNLIVLAGNLRFSI